MHEKIAFSIDQAAKAISFLSTQQAQEFIQASANMLANSFAEGGKLLVAGNGGSLCDAMHFAEELTGFYRKKRPALPAIALSDPGHMSCVGNDVGFQYVFSRGIEALGQVGDVFVALTTSGNSSNLIHAVEAAKKKGIKTIAFLGKGGGALKGMCDLELIIEGFSTSDRIQEAHMAAIHIIIEVIEELLFYGFEPLYGSRETISAV